jgi:hypothetical protein
MRVRLECDEPIGVEVVDDPPDVLPVSAEVARKPRNRLRPFGSGDRAEDLPAGAGQPEGGDQAKRTPAGDALTNLMLDLFRATSLILTAGDYAVWESTAAFRSAFSHPEFVAKLSAYPSSAVATPHLFQKVAVNGVCVA